MHQAIRSTLRALAMLKPLAGIVDVNHLIDTALLNAAYATNCVLQLSQS
jgi:hypothetical protein